MEGEMAGTLNDLNKHFAEQFAAASGVVKWRADSADGWPAFGERDGARAQIQATLALAAAVRMLVELFGTGAVVNATTRKQGGGS